MRYFGYFEFAYNATDQRDRQTEREERSKTVLHWVNTLEKINCVQLNFWRFDAFN